MRARDTGLRGMQAQVDLRRVAARLQAAQRPLVWLGGSQWSPLAVGAVLRFAEASGAT
jgi:thiamine pyrophosphate-dependent acetolactate synthase large subunit-like protein